jgi:PelA/Pel-15E family pectate lyase
MRLDSPDQRVIKATEDAVAWLRSTQLNGIRVQRISAPETTYESHTENFDVVVLPDADAKPIWARHYEIETDRPVFAGRDAVKRYALSEIERERRTGTPWYGAWPSELLKRDYPAWRKKLSTPSAASKP